MSDKNRSEIDPFFKQILISYFRDPFGVAIETEVEVSRLPRTIDAVMLLKSSKEIAKVRDGTPFYYVKKHNQIEFKGKNDHLTMVEFRFILGRANLYLAGNGLDANDVSVTIVSAGKPRKLLARSEFESLGQGYYRTVGINPTVIIVVVNELEIAKKNYPVLLFTSSRRKFKKVLRSMAANDCLDQYLAYAYGIDPTATKEVAEMPKGQYALSEEQLKFVKEDIGDKLLPLFSTEDRLRGLAAEDRLRGLATEDRLRGLSVEEILGLLSAKKQEEFFEQLHNLGFKRNNQN